MTENYISEDVDTTFTTADALIVQIEAMLQQVAQKTIVDAGFVQDGLLDLMQSVRSMA